MLLRGSGETSKEFYNLSGVLDGGDIGVEDEVVLMAIADAVVAKDTIELANVRRSAVLSFGAEKFIDAIGVASGFNGITKIANATGIPLDIRTEKVTESLRRETGIDDYSENYKAGLYD